MPMLDETDSIRPSLLTLLMDDDPHRQSESEIPNTQPARIVESVIQDLVQLLNSRVRSIHWKDRGRAKGTPWDYGIPDFSGADSVGISRAELVSNWIASTIRSHEPRLKSVDVSAASPRDGNSRTITVRIEAELTIEPFQKLVLTSSFESSTGRLGVIESKE